MRKHYYAEYSPYGINTSYQSFRGPGRNGYTFHRFDSRAARDEWVLDNQYDRVGNIVAGDCTRAAVVYNLGKEFEVDDDGICFDARPAW